MTLLVAVLIAVLALLCWFHSRSLLFPPLVFCSVWAGVLIALALSGDAFYPLSNLTLFLCALSCLAFSAGGIAFSCLHGGGKPRQMGFRSAQEDRGTLWTIDALFVVFAGLYPFYWERLAAIGQGSVGLYLLQAVRTEMTQEDMGSKVGLGVFSYVLFTSILITLIVTTETCRLKLPRWRFFLWIALTMAYNIPTGARLGSLVLMFGVFAIFAFVKGRFPFVAALSIGICVLFIFAVVSIVLGKGGSLENSPLENVRGVTQSLQVYTLGGIVACDQLLQHSPETSDKAPSLHFFYEVGAALGLNSPAPPLRKREVLTPWTTNVYSIYYDYLLDFGWVGISIIFIALGAAMTSLHRLAVMGSPEAITLLGLGCSYLILTCAGDPFIVGLSACIQSVALVLLIYNLVPLLRWCTLLRSPSPNPYTS
jgi:oligosaccharide repeat unit polymerase